jgi:hypothetical protein
MPLDLVVALNEHRPTALGLMWKHHEHGNSALLQARAGKLGCVIIADAGYEKGLDFRPLPAVVGSYPVWGRGLPAEGIADALDRIERERRLWLEFSPCQSPHDPLCHIRHSRSNNFDDWSSSFELRSKNDACV